MRVLVIGAGAIGGYFGGRLLEAHRDITFLVRPRRAAELAHSGLIIKSPRGDLRIPSPKTVTADQLHEQYDLILLSCKAYDLTAAMAAFAPAVGPATAIVPLLNGMQHLDALDQRFGREHVLGGLCMIAVTLDSQRTVVHMNDLHTIVFGERDRSDSERVRQISKLMEGARFDFRASKDIVASMWEKWVFLATLAGSTCLMRSSVADICAAPGGSDFVLKLLEENCAIAASAGYTMNEAFLARSRRMLTAADSTLTASMLRDIEANSRIEADHIIGDLLRRGDASASPRLRVVYSHLKAYEARRARESAAE